MRRREAWDRGAPLPPLMSMHQKADFDWVVRPGLKQLGWVHQVVPMGSPGSQNLRGEARLVAIKDSCYSLTGFTG